MQIHPPTSFTLASKSYEFDSPARHGAVGDVRSWELGQYPKVYAQVPLKGGGTLGVYAEARHWNATQIHVRWFDDSKDSLVAWLPKDDVRPVTDSEWDIDQYSRCPNLQYSVRWADRLPGFMPA